MKAVVDKDTCIGCGTCMAIADNVFQMDDQGLAQGTDFKEEDKDLVEEAKEACPAQAIHIE